MSVIIDTKKVELIRSSAPGCNEDVVKEVD